MATTMPYVRNGRKYGVIVTTKKGKRFVKLNPYGKSQKAFAELKCGYHITNEGAFKKNERGQRIPLTAKQRAWRAGYATHQADSAKVFKKKRKYYGGKR